MPVRIQRKRTSGWRMPGDTIYVGRPTRYGNKYTVKEYGRVGAVMLYERDIVKKEWYMSFVRKTLRGYNLACWCPVDQPCHADILLRIANS